MARRKNDGLRKTFFCHRCGKQIMFEEVTNDPAILCLGMGNKVIKNNKEYGCPIRVIIGEKKISGRNVKDYRDYNVCCDCMTVEDVQESSLIPEAKERKLQYIKDRIKI
jgi:hypothetical protein